MQEHELQIPKKRIEVKLFFDRPGGLTGEHSYLFLSQFSRLQAGPETLHEFLNCGNLFIPAVSVQTKAFNIISLETVVYVEETEIQPAPDSEKKITFHFIGGGELTADNSELLPVYHARPIDYLNGTDTFLEFMRDGVRLFVNKRKIGRVSGL